MTHCGHPVIIDVMEQIKMKFAEAAAVSGNAACACTN
jgi:hypothetical protein